MSWACLGRMGAAKAHPIVGGEGPSSFPRHPHFPPMCRPSSSRWRLLQGVAAIAAATAAGPSEDRPKAAGRHTADAATVPGAVAAAVAASGSGASVGAGASGLGDAGYAAPALVRVAPTFLGLLQACRSIAATHQMAGEGANGAPSGPLQASAVGLAADPAAAGLFAIPGAAPLPAAHRALLLSRLTEASGAGAGAGRGEEGGRPCPIVAARGSCGCANTTNTIGQQHRNSFSSSLLSLVLAKTVGNSPATSMVMSHSQLELPHRH